MGMYFFSPESITNKSEKKHINTSYMYRKLPIEIVRTLSRRLALIYEAFLLSGTCTAWKLSCELQTKTLILSHRSTTPITWSVSLINFCFVSKSCSKAHRLISLSLRPTAVLQSRSAQEMLKKLIQLESAPFLQLSWIINRVWQPRDWIITSYLPISIKTYSMLSETAWTPSFFLLICTPFTTLQFKWLVWGQF